MQRLLLVLATLAAPAGGATDPAGGPGAALRGLEIFREADRRESGFADLLVDLEMVLRNARGDETRRQLSIKQLEVPDDGDKILIVFETPKSIKGTALLSYSHRVGVDDQWLYLPAVKRVKKIASRNKSGPFLGSEFAYEDLTSQEVEKFTYRFLERSDLDGAAQWVVERTPVDPLSGYTRQVVWLDASEYRISRIDYYDRKDSLLKTLSVLDYALYEERFWKARRMVMNNHQTGRSTELIWDGYAFGNGLSADRDFSTNALRRSR